MEESLLIRLLGDTPLIRIMDFLIENSIFDYTKTALAENAGISRASLYNAWPVLERFRLVTESRKIGNTTLYRLNRGNPVVKQLMELDLELSMEFADSLEPGEQYVAAKPSEEVMDGLAVAKMRGVEREIKSGKKKVLSESEVRRKHGF